MEATTIETDFVAFLHQRRESIAWCCLPASIEQLHPIERFVAFFLDNCSSWR